MHETVVSGRVAQIACLSHPTVFIHRLSACSDIGQPHVLLPPAALLCGTSRAPRVLNDTCTCYHFRQFLHHVRACSSICVYVVLGLCIVNGVCCCSVTPVHFFVYSHSGIQDPVSRVLDLSSIIQDPASWIQDPGSWSSIKCPAPRILDSGSRILEPGFWIQGQGPGPWILILNPGSLVLGRAREKDSWSSKWVGFQVRGF
jgi:hypothetical protein